jgi:hypothetical protein
VIRNSLSGLVTDVVLGADEATEALSQPLGYCLIEVAAGDDLAKVARFDQTPIACQ